MIKYIFILNIVITFYIFIFILYNHEYLLYSTNRNMFKKIKYQSYLTKIFYKTNRDYAFYDNVRLGVLLWI